jgi:FG-GAP-like repeat/Galactose oxidase, central domain
MKSSGPISPAVVAVRQFGGLILHGCRPGKSVMMPLIFVIASFPSTVMAQSGTFTATGNMTVARSFHSATLLDNGQVLIAGSGTADIYEPQTGTFTALGNHGSAIATPLADGRVLFIVKDSAGKNTAEIFDPASRTFTTSGTSVTGQIGGYATLLPNGQVLVAGGFIAVNSQNHANPELYDPATGTFSATGSFVTTGRASAYVAGGPDISAVVRLADGRVLFAGEPVSEVYDPVSGTFSLTGVMTTPCGLGGRPDYIAGRTATLLTNGKVLLTGGEQEDCGRFADAEIYDPATGIFTATGKMSRARDNHAATLLSDGTVLITGGESQDCVGGRCSFFGTTTSAEVYNPSTGTFTLAGAMLVGRGGQTATLLKNGAVLLAGGYGFAGIGQYLGQFASAELYNPPGSSVVVFGSANSLNDFNGDGKADILRRDSAGNVSIWLMNGGAVMSQTFVANVWPGWSIVGSGDFNGDGKADILWRDPAGSVVMWLMDGAAIASYGIVANVPTDWSIAGIGDFNGDRKADILWRHSSGDVRVWLMDGYSIADNSTVANISTSWSIAGVGDFNGDRKADVLWRSSAGDVGVWLMDGSSVASWSIPGNVPSTAAVAGVADFNADGKGDILWRDSLGNVSLWLMDGLNVTNSSLIANIWTGWAITGVGDFNGDRNADILWQDLAGHEVVWSMNGSTIASYGETY